MKMATARAMYAWREGVSFRVDAQVAGEHIEALLEQHEGAITPVQVVEDAKQPSSPIHGEFEWDDAVAGEKWRLQTARQLVNNLVIVAVERDDKPEQPATRAFVSVSNTGTNGRGYVALARVLSDDDLYQETIGEILAMIRSYRQKLESLKELRSSLKTAFDTLEKTLQDETEAK